MKQIFVSELGRKELEHLIRERFNPDYLKIHGPTEYLGVIYCSAVFEFGK